MAWIYSCEELVDELASVWSILRASTTGQVAVVVTAGIIISWAMKKRYKLPPGPRPLPLLGNVLALKGVPMPEKFDKWKRQFGPVFTCYMGPVMMIVLNDVETITEAFVKQGSDFSGRPYIYTMDRISEGSKDIVFGTYGEVWKYQRKIAATALRQYLKGTLLERRVHEALKPVIDVILSQKGAFDPHKALCLSIFNVIHGLCFGTPLSIDDPAFQELLAFFDDSTEVAGNGYLEDIFPPLRWWPTKRFRKVMAGVDNLNAYIHKQFDDHKANFSEDRVESLVDNIILAQQKAMEEDDPAIIATFTDTHAAQIVADVFNAGVVTSRSTMDWLFLVLAAFPDVQKRIQEEVDNAVGDDIPGREHRTKLAYLEAVLYETMRMYYVVPIGVPHLTIRDTCVGGYEIPDKTIILTNNKAAMYDPRHWDDPMTFKPERFLDETGTKIKTRHKSWFPFSMGDRSCVGESLAKMELVYIIAGLLQKLTFSLPSDTKPNFKTYKPGLTNVPHPYKVMVTPRKMF